MKKEFSYVESDLYETPPEIFEPLEKEFGPFQLDPAATRETKKGITWCGPDAGLNGLDADWKLGTTNTKVWCNPPYSKEGKKDLWIKKCYDEAQKGCLVVALLPAKTDTKSFHDYIYNKPNVEVRFLKKRIRFLLNGKRTGCGRFASMVVIFYPPGHSYMMDADELLLEATRKVGW